MNAVGPGVVETPLTAPTGGPGLAWSVRRQEVFNRWATTEEMAGPTVFLASDAASFVTGTLLMADGGWTAVDGRFNPPA